MKIWGVKVPIAGHAFIEVEAATEEEALEKAFDSEITLDHVESWDALRRFNQGNICFCPSPWEAEAELLEDDEESEVL